MERFFGSFVPTTREYVTFKAGRCDVEDKGNNKFLITPDRRKGQLTLLKHVDELTHLQWKDRTTNTVVEDVIAMPHDAYFARVNTGREKDRVYILQYQGGSSRRFFFWMQSASDEKDEELVKRLNECMTNPPPSEAEEGGAGGTGAAGGTGDAPASQQNVEDLLSSMLGGGTTGAQTRVPGPSAAVTAPASGSSSAGATGRGGQLTAADLQRAMMNLTGMQQQQQQQRTVPLTEIVNADEVLRSGVLSDPAVQEQLIPLLAEGQQTPEQLEAIMHSPQFRSTLGSLTGALQTDNFNSIMSNFGLDASRGMEALSAGNNVDAFLQALLALQQQEGEAGDRGEGGEKMEEEKDEGKE
ncbi:adhesion regulating molecule 1 [Nannochloropsis oceanica]